jgi:[acyl-carrier-protein] S-malonyltransferase
MERAFVFPGQGSHYIGMGAELARSFVAARHVFDEVDDALGQNLSGLMFDGSEADLTMTANTQPALMAVSLAVFRVLETESGGDLTSRARFVAGHSLGEASALAAAGAIGIADAARLLRCRGEAMQAAAPEDGGAMAAILGLDLEAVEAVAKEASKQGVCEVANDNASAQVVVSGEAAAVELAIELAAKRGARRTVRLPVSAPFHCALMAPAAEATEKALSEIDIRPPAIPLVANITARETSDPAVIRRLLIEQVTGRVRWRESVLYMRDSKVDCLVELGAGRVLSGLARRIDRSLKTIAVEKPEDITAFLKTL